MNRTTDPTTDPLIQIILERRLRKARDERMRRGKLSQRKRKFPKPNIRDFKKEERK